MRLSRGKRNGNIKKGGLGPSPESREPNLTLPNGVILLLVLSFFNAKNGACIGAQKGGR